MYSLTGKFKSFHILLNRIPRHILRAGFRFDKWHLISPIEKRYVTDLISYLNQLPESQRESVLEIGCGLGDIIRRLKFIDKTGYDGEAHVVKAARFIGKVTFDRTKFIEFVFPFSRLKGAYNAILMVNWIHHISPAVLKSSIELFFAENILDNGCIVIDTVQAKNYKHNHDINFLTSGICCRLVKIGSYENQRDIYAIFK